MIYRKKVGCTCPTIKVSLADLTKVGFGLTLGLAVGGALTIAIAWLVEPSGTLLRTSFEGRRERPSDLSITHKSQILLNPGLAWPKDESDRAIQFHEMPLFPRKSDRVHELSDRRGDLWVIESRQTPSSNSIAKSR